MLGRGGSCSAFFSRRRCSRESGAGVEPSQPQSVGVAAATLPSSGAAEPHSGAHA